VKQRSVLIVDLNNFARYPTIAIGYLTSILRKAGMDVQIYSPLTIGVTGMVREPRARAWSLIDQKLRYWSSVSTNPLVHRARAALATLHAPKLARSGDIVAQEFERRLGRSRPDAVLVSTYLMYMPQVRQLAAICKRMAVPMLVGGQYFADEAVVKEWLDIDGLKALVGGEVEPYLLDIVNSMIDGQDLSRFPGVQVPGKPFHPAPPLKELDAVPFADYTDFPWHLYPNKIIPLITGRGCGWGVCTFCSDVTTSAGRTYRSRSPENVLAELRHQSQVHEAKLFAFTDLKLNSNLAVWHALLENFQKAAPGAEWIGAVHVGVQQKQPTGLSADELRQAYAAGMRRLTTGLESGSQRLLDSMCKGTDLRVTSQFLHDATAAGISVRTTMIIGYPGEEASDVLATAKFLEEHRNVIDRIQLNRFQILSGTRFEENLRSGKQSREGLTQLTVNQRMAHVEHHYVPTEDPKYRRAVSRLLRAVHRINRRELNGRAQQFEGVM
jgi:anaerobic magnesium-protoporphyrin IX monomethyl ester cyclase